MGAPIRLQKILAQAGFGSRRACEAFILEGRVTVDGAVVRHLGSKADPEMQVVMLDGEKVAGPGKAGRRLKGQSERVYYALNKPVGVLCTNEDPAGRPLAVHMIPEKRRLFCVGRLDLDTEGLLLLTNDGELTHLLTHPRFGVPKTYLAKVGGAISTVQLAKLKKGVFLSEGRTQGASVRVRKRGKKTSTVEVTIQEGLNRQVRRMLAAVGLQCRNLRRIRIGPLELGAMPNGAYRMLGREEVEALRRATQQAEGARVETGAADAEDGDRRRTGRVSGQGKRSRSPDRVPRHPHGGRERSRHGDRDDRSGRRERHGRTDRFGRRKRAERERGEGWPARGGKSKSRRRDGRSGSRKRPERRKAGRRDGERRGGKDRSRGR